ncbi:MAG: COQ9 family protein [Proteobacteria bacterium]|nr:COQ9 family protein [Pseudomonadota bacterium]
MSYSTESPQGAAEIRKLRDAVLVAALPHVPFDGWTEATLARGAADAGLAPEEASRAFPGGAIDAIAHHSRRADARMLAALEAETGEGQEPTGQKSRGMTATVRRAIQLRLEASMGEREAIRRALAILGRPQHAPLAARLLYRTVDAIWYVAGDNATDFNFYTKRGLLAAVYSATVLYWLDDRSEGCAETWAFLDRRLADVLRVPKAMARAERLIGGLPSPFRVLRMARNRATAGFRPPGR